MLKEIIDGITIAFILRNLSFTEFNVCLKSYNLFVGKAESFDF